MDKMKVANELVRLAKSLMAADKISVGDKVKLSRKFLQSIGEHSAGRLTGVVEELVPLGSTTLAKIKWDGDWPEKVNVKNLVLKSKVHLEAV